MLVAVCWWLVVVPADAVSGVGDGWVYHTWVWVRVAELGGATVAPWSSEAVAMWIYGRRGVAGAVVVRRRRLGSGSSGSR